MQGVTPVCRPCRVLADASLPTAHRGMPPASCRSHRPLLHTACASYQQHQQLPATSPRTSTHNPHPAAPGSCALTSQPQQPSAPSSSTTNTKTPSRLRHPTRSHPSLTAPALTTLAAASMPLQASASTPDTANSTTTTIPSTSTTAAALVPPPNGPMPPASFQPQLPDTSVLVAQGSVIVLSAAAAAYWWLVVVPTERAAVGRSKRMGALNTYLSELEQPEAVESRRLERWFYTDWLQQRQKRRDRLGRSAVAPAAATSTAASTAAGTEQGAGSGAGDTNEVPGATADQPYLQDPDPRVAGDLLRPTVDTPTPRFLSLDNPLVATALLIAAVGVVSSLLSR